MRSVYLLRGVNFDRSRDRFKFFVEQDGQIDFSAGAEHQPHFPAARFFRYLVVELSGSLTRGIFRKTCDRSAESLRA